MTVLHGTRKHAGWEATEELVSVGEGRVSVLREFSGEVILVISGRAAGCTKALSQRSEGAIFSKRSKPQGTDRSPHDASTIIAGGLK
jgi:hypothetical protein